jgi:hypothetical protein
MVVGEAEESAGKLSYGASGSGNFGRQPIIIDRLGLTIEANSHQRATGNKQILL